MSKVMIIEDDMQINNVYKKVLVAVGHDVVGVKSIEEAEKMLKEFTPSVFIIDRMLPKESGDEFIKRYDFGMAVPFMITGSVIDDEYIIEKMKSGLLYVLKKPVAMNMLQQCVEAAARYSELRECQNNVLNVCDELKRALDEAENSVKEAMKSSRI